MRSLPDYEQSYLAAKILLHDEPIMDSFMQTWPNTARGLDYIRGMSGQAFTGEYTSVFSCNGREERIVFFGNTLAYIVRNPNQKFYDDLKNRMLASQREAVGKYGADITYEN